jgi:hypothetical protein
MVDNSSWLKRLLANTEKRKTKKISLWKILKNDKTFYNAASLLWFVVLLFIFAYVFMELGFIPHYFSNLKNMVTQLA